MANIATLISDVENLLENGCEPSDENLSSLGTAIATMVGNRLREPLDPKPRGGLRMSNVGKPDRQLWYDLHDPTNENLSASSRLKFLYGDIIELICLFFAKEAGHDVTNEQAEVEVNGVLGHIDAVIDGVVVDVKSAATHAFKKFGEKLDTDDPFSYIEQLSGYSTGLGGLNGAFWVVDKQLGHQRLLEVPREDMEAIDVPGRIDHLKEVLANDTEIPDRCYDPKPEGKSGNEILSVGCNYCDHKFKCWSHANNGIGLRTFLYSTGPKHFTRIEREPSGPLEVTF